jgi:hypothetical protein
LRGEIWVNGEHRLSFRRTFSGEMMQSWDDLLYVIEQVKLTDESDALVWSCARTRVYSSHSFYSIINYRGVTPIYIPTI